MNRAISLAALALAIGTLHAAPASAQVGGSYRASCTDVEQRGPYLRALCRDVRGNYVPAQIDTSSCNGPVANSNGRLTCGGGGGGRGDGYGRGGRDDGYGRGDGYGRRGRGGYDEDEAPRRYGPRY